MALKFRLLRADEIEVRIQQTKQNGLSVLLYKTARTDANLLDETVGAENWQNDFKCIDGKMFGIISIKCDEEWVSKSDSGSEGNIEAEKSLASDAFKRAGFKWGIGRELYTAPFIWISADHVEIKQSGQKYTCNEKFSVSKIEYNDNREIIALEIVNGKGKTVYTFGTKTPIKTEKIIKKEIHFDAPVIDDEIPFSHPDDWMTVNAFAGEISRCNDISKISALLNSQKGNPHLNDLIPLASARKQEIIATLGA